MGKCYNSTVINAPIEKVWDTIKNFHELPWGSAVVTSTKKVGNKQSNEVGAQRILNDAFHETLVSISNDEFTFSYRIDDGPGPVAKDTVLNYFGTVKLSPVTDSGETFIEWSSSFDSDNSNEVREFCNPIYAGLLDSLNAYLT
ncbi:SRPBCC family protein [Neptunomonas sp.]|uniref:SRPBCC family protein n=1 Tax=Neptunomonas sp. TaxID=1971898 RepID=UPI0025ED57A9|nr:SRPBCC family protein [Neptunomonas sp.]